MIRRFRRRPGRPAAISGKQSRALWVEIAVNAGKEPGAGKRAGPILSKAPLKKGQVGNDGLFGKTVCKRL